LIISILLLLVIAIVSPVMSLESNPAFGQWILPSTELKNAYKLGYHESNVTIDEEDVKQK